MYMEEYRAAKRLNQKKIAKLYSRLKTEHAVSSQSHTKEFNYRIAKKVFHEYIKKGTIQVLSWPGNFTLTRAYLYADLCGELQAEVNEQAFSAGVHRFGIDNPTPTITQRLATYGNTEDVDKTLQELSKKYNDLRMYDPGLFVKKFPDQKYADDKKYAEREGIPFERPKAIIKDMEETQVPGRTTKKVAGVHDIRLLEKLDNAKKFASPAEEIMARGRQIKIKDITKEGDMKPEKSRMDKMTTIEWGINGDKQILVPSFGTTGALFSRHFDILRNLKRRVVLLQQSSEA